jgi:hypothetical protein
MKPVDIQESIDLMGAHLLKQFEHHLAGDEPLEEDIKDAYSVMNEWVVDGRNPEDGNYEFLFVPYLNN